MNKRRVLLAVGVILLAAILCFGASCGPEPVSREEYQASQKTIDDRLSGVEEAVKGLPEIQKGISGIQDQIKDLQADIAEKEVERQKTELESRLAEIEKEVSEIKDEVKDRDSYPYRPPRPTPHPSKVYPDRFVAEVYNGENFGQYVGSFSESTIDHNWDYGGPLGLTDHFYVKWEGEVWFEEGRYQFQVRADDEVRLYIDDELLVDKWGRQPATTYWAEKYLTRGYHQIRVKYFDFQGESVIKLSWN